MFLILSLSLKTTDVSNVNAAQKHPGREGKGRKRPFGAAATARRRGRTPASLRPAEGPSPPGEREMPSLWLWILYLPPLLPLRDPREPFFESKRLGIVFLRRKKN